MSSLSSSMIFSVVSAMGPLLCVVEALAEPARVPWGIGLVVVIEIHVDVAAGAAPAVDERGPFVELVVAVAAGVELLRAVQPYISEAGGALQRPRVVVGAVGGDQGDVVGGEQLQRRL